jgi:hypothetical protein
MKPEIEDGMGFSGLVSTKAEREQDKHDQAERKRMRMLAAERDALILPLRDLVLMVEDYVFSGGKRQVDRDQLLSALRDAKAAFTKVTKGE